MTSTHRQEHNVWRLEGILTRQQDAPMVHATFEGCVWWPSDGKVPLEQVVLVMHTQGIAGE